MIDQEPFAVALDEVEHRHDERGRIGDVVPLDDKLLRDSGQGLVAKNLFSGDPAFRVHHVEPVGNDVDGDFRVPLVDEEEMEALVPEEPAGEEASRGDGRVQTGRPVRHRGRVVRRLDFRMAVEVTNPSDEVAKGSFGKVNRGFIKAFLLQVKGRLELVGKSVPERRRI